MTPTYDQLVAEAAKRGITMSEYDLGLAKENPTAGFGILNAISDYKNASTAEAKALAHSNAENWRATGNYSGGADGYSYNPFLQPSTGNTAIDAKTTLYNNYPAWSYQTSQEATGKYGDIWDRKLDDVYNYAPFSYDYKNDPLYGQYKQAYTREGQRATADTIGQAAAASGGIPSSYAVTAAQQAGNYYSAQLADKIPELYQLAYQQYADQYNRLVNNANLAGNRYGTALDQFNIDRSFDYGVYSDDFNRIGNQIGVLTEQDNTTYQRQQDAMNDARSRVEQYLSAGGDLANLPADLRAASGLTDAELNALALYAAQQLAGRGRGGGGNPTPEDLSGTLDTNAYNMLLSQIRGMSGTQEAINLLRQYTPYMTESQKNVAYREAGIGADIVAKGWKDGTGITDAYLDLLTPTLPSAADAQLNPTADGNPGWTSAELLEAAAAGMSRAQIEQALKDRGVDTTDLALRKQITWALGK